MVISNHNQGHVRGVPFPAEKVDFHRRRKSYGTASLGGDVKSSPSQLFKEPYAHYRGCSVGQNLRGLFFARSTETSDSGVSEGRLSTKVA